jgi:transposase
VAVPFVSQRARLSLSEADQSWLRTLSQSRSESVARVQRAQILRRYAQGETVSAIAAALDTNRPKVERTIAKALELGVRAALQDLPGRGRRTRIDDADRAWVVQLACQKPKHLGYAEEMWTTQLLAKHVRQHCAAAGYPALAKLGRGTVSKILRKQELQPHKVEYYLELRDPEFEAKMVQVLHVYRDVSVWQKHGLPAEVIGVLSYDEKPGIQAIANTAPDLPPVPGKHTKWARDHEYKRLGTWSLLAGIDLLNGEVLGLVRERHRSREFIEFLRLADQHYPAGARIRLVLDNHSAHISRETRAYLGTVPNRFEFIFTPKHGSWLNLVESFFGKMARTLLRNIRVSSKEELRARIELYLQEINQDPVVFKWKYKLETVADEPIAS